MTSDSGVLERRCKAEDKMYRNAIFTLTPSNVPFCAAKCKGDRCFLSTIFGSAPRFNRALITGTQFESQAIDKVLRPVTCKF